MRRFVSVLLVSVALAGCASTQSANPNAYVRKEIVIEPVSEVTVNGPFKVMIFGTSDKSEVSFNGPANQMEDAVAIVEDGALTIEFAGDAGWSWNPGAGMNVVVHVPILRSIALNGSGQVDIYNVKADKFAAGTGGSGSISIEQLEAGEVQLGIGGSGSIEAKGTATSAQMGVGGSGSIEAKRLRVETAQIGIGGSGSIYADVSQKAEIGVGGSGRVEVVGGAECVFAEAQASQIECR